jgi:predicted metalloprotease with PDZ domain
MPSPKKVPARLPAAKSAALPKPASAATKAAATPGQAGKTTRAARTARRAAPATRALVAYRVLLSRPEAHLFTVECSIPAPDPAGERFALPAWIPGSYLVRDFARHVVAMAASADGKVARVEKTCKDQWLVPPGPSKSLTVRIEVYAWDLSVRGAHLDTRHAFFNGTSLFLRVLGREHHACTVELERPKGKAYAEWRVATAMPRAGATERFGFGLYQAPDYAELIDHPVEMGRFDLVQFEAEGVHHDFALSGVHRADLKRLRADLTKICGWQIRFWGNPAPMARYVFLATAVGEGYGGLEHRASTALILKRDDLPKPPPAGKKSDPTIDERYRNFLGLASHEYFHTWLVKRIQPAEFTGPNGIDLQRENPTEMLWLFEGFTSYYDDLTLLRSGLISDTDYLVCLSKTVAAVFGTPGRFRQSVAEASFDAWIKYYKPDENTPNSTISYYAKGALVALALDLTLRQATLGNRSLDDVMRQLWAEHGRTGRGVSEADLRRIVTEQLPELPARQIKQFFDYSLHGTADLPIAELLATHGVKLAFEGAGAPSLGIRLDAKADGEARIAVAFEGSAAQKAGLSALDTLVAIDGLRVTGSNLDTLLAHYRVGDVIDIHAFRRDELREFRLTLQAAQPASCSLNKVDDPSKAALRLRKSWLQAGPG